MLQPNHGDSQEMADYIAKTRKETAKFIGHYSKVNSKTYMYTNYAYKNEWVFIVHGIGGSAKKMSPYVKNFMDLGYNTVTIGTRRNLLDFINNWEQDITDTLKLLRTQYNISPTVIYGQSLGAAAVLSIVSKNEYQFRNVIVDSPFDNFKTTASNMYPIGSSVAWPFIKSLNYPRYIVEKVKTIETPILYCNGLNDQVTTPDQVKTLIKATQNAEYISVKKAGHCRAMYYNPKAYWEKIAKFIGDPTK